MKALILVCASALSPGDCTTETAAAVIQGPDVGGPVSCALHGQAYLAETPLARYLDGGHYLQIVCEPANRLRQARAGGPSRVTVAQR
ncbi:MAG TPA: hypothetical protein VFZ01_15070 [Geminicoccaceae bacterium]